MVIAMKTYENSNHFDFGNQSQLEELPRCRAQAVLGGAKCTANFSQRAKVNKTLPAPRPRDDRRPSERMRLLSQSKIVKEYSRVTASPQNALQR